MNIRMIFTLIILTGTLANCLVEAKSVPCTQASYEEIQRLYRALNAWGMEIQLELTHCNPEALRSSPDEIKTFIRQLCTILGMQRPQPMIIHNDKETAGYTFAVLAEQGTLCGRLINKNNSAFFTILSNKPCNPKPCVEHACLAFDTTKCVLTTTLKI